MFQIKHKLFSITTPLVIILIIGSIMRLRAEYIWVDGTQAIKELRSKARILRQGNKEFQVADLPQWGYDGSSTNQAPGKTSDLILRPVNTVRDPQMLTPISFVYSCSKLWLR
jgi:hypothetical protein